MGDDERGGSAEDPAEAAVAGQDLFVAPGEAGAIPVAHIVVGLAQPAAVEVR